MKLDLVENANEDFFMVTRLNPFNMEAAFQCVLYTIRHGWVLKYNFQFNGS